MDRGLEPKEGSPPPHRSSITGKRTSSSNDESGGGNGGNGSGRGTPTTNRHLRDKVAYYEKVWSAEPIRIEGDEEDIGGIDVHALEKRLKEERDRRHGNTEDGQRIEFVKLRSTPVSSPRGVDTTDHIGLPHVILRHRVETGDSGGGNDSHMENIEKVFEEGHFSGDRDVRTIKIEKVTVRKSVREVTTAGGMKSVVYVTDSSRTPSEEHLQQDDSAYQTHSQDISVGSKSSSYASLHDRFSSEERIDSRRATPSREVYVTTTSEHPDSTGKMKTTTRMMVTTTGDGFLPGGSVTVSNRYQQSPLWKQTGDSTSTVISGHFTPTRISVEREIFSDGSGVEIGPGLGSGFEDQANAEWYNEYRTQSFQNTMAARQFARSNSQYDSHIREIRGKKHLRMYMYIKKRFEQIK